jgi:hypothetical protein
LPGLAYELLHACRLRELLAQEINFHGQQRESLAEVVVELARDAPRFALLTLKQPAGQPSKLGLAQSKIPFRLPAVRPVKEQSDDEQGLQNEEAYRADDWPPV